MSDGDRGLIDLAHLAATLESYLTTSIIPDFWAGWGGDLATGMADTTANINNNRGPGKPYEGMTDQEIADATIGKEGLQCNYTDFCCDFDAYKIAYELRRRFINEPAENWNTHLLSDTIQWYYTYYTNLYHHRFLWVVEELGCSAQINEIKNTVKQFMYIEIADFGIIGPINVLRLKGNSPNENVVEICCSSFANYIYKMITE